MKSEITLKAAAHSTLAVLVFARRVSFSSTCNMQKHNSLCIDTCEAIAVASVELTMTLRREVGVRVECNNALRTFFLRDPERLGDFIDVNDKFVTVYSH